MSEATYDAVLIPRTAVKGATEPAKLQWIKDTFGPLLGAARVHARTVGADLLCTKDPIAHLYHRDDHPNAGQDRYKWTDVTDGWKLGTLEKADV